MENPQVFIITPRKELFIPPQASPFPKASPQQKKKKCSFMNLWYGGLGKISEPQLPLFNSVQSRYRNVSSCWLLSMFSLQFRVSEYPFKQSKNVKKHESAIITWFYNVSLNVLRQPFSKYIIYPFHALRISGKLESTLDQKLTTVPTLWGPAPTE